jgi:two-component system invasion response regulator UvrY
VDHALAVCKSHSITIAVIDARLPPNSGIALIGQLKVLYPAMRFIGITTFEEKPTLLEFVEAGVMGIVLKRKGSTLHLRESILAVASGETYFIDEVKQILGSYPYPANHSASSKFNVKELLILSGLAKGLGTKEISSQVDLTPYTVDAYRGDMLRRTGTKKTAELISYAYKNGLL